MADCYCQCTAALLHCLLQDVNACIKQKDGEQNTCGDCKAGFACPSCSRPAPDSHRWRDAFQCQHAPWNALVVGAKPAAGAQPAAGGVVKQEQMQQQQQQQWQQQQRR